MSRLTALMVTISELILAFPLPNVTGRNALVFVGQHSQTEVTATFAAATPTSTNP